MKDTVSLLLLTCGTNACFHISKRLKEKFGERIRIVGTDINQGWLIPTYHYLDAFYQCPFTSDDNYYTFILSVCTKESIDYLLPSFDADQILFHQNNADLEKIGVRSLGITQAAKKIYGSKEDTNLFLEQHHLPVPGFYMINQLEDESEYFCKPRNGVGSAGVKKLTGKEIKESKDDSLIIEELCYEPEVTLECFNYKGKVYSVARERLDTKAGVCTKARVYYDKDLEAIAQQFVDTIDLPYIFNLQFMTNSKGHKVITDVNLRTAGGMSLSFAAGWDETEALGKIMLGEDNVIKTLKSPEHETYVIRAYTDIVTKTCKQRIAFDLDGTLLDSRKRHQLVMDDVLKEYGIIIDTSDLLSYKAEGHNNKEWLSLKQVSEDKIEKINMRWMQLIEDKQYLASDVLYNDILPVLKRLSQYNALFLITARNNKENAEKQIEDIGIKEFFDAVEIVPSSKKTSEDKARLLKLYGIEMFYGDTESDMKAAEYANCEFRAVANGFRSQTYWNKMNVETTEIN